MSFLLDVTKFLSFLQVLISLSKSLAEHNERMCSMISFGRVTGRLIKKQDDSCKGGVFYFIFYLETWLKLCLK